MCAVSASERQNVATGSATVADVHKEIIGDCVLYRADCREVLPTLCKVDAVVTDPPYGVNFAEWDQSAAMDWLPAARLLAPSVYITTGIKNLHDWAAPDWIAAYSFPNGFKRATGGGFNSWEPVLIYGRNALQLDHKQFPPVASEKVEGHPCPKPLGPFRWLVAEATAPGACVLDPFMGSGTTGVACINLGRSFIGIEREPSYFDIACRRIEEAYKQPRLFDEPAPKAVQPSLLDGAA